VGGAGLGYTEPANGTDLQDPTFEFVLKGRHANDRRSTDGLGPTPDEWMQLIRLFSMIKAMP
jgi:hypothetical protein